MAMLDQPADMRVRILDRGAVGGIIDKVVAASSLSRLAI
jgi:hypothetical protein